jgi:uncharacterized MAPEG superfamily protein
MITETQSLLGVTALFAALILLQGALTGRYHGARYGLGPRDEPIEKTVLERRIQRTISNHLEGMALFIPLVMALEAKAISTSLTQAGAMTFLAARVAFSVLYLLGVPLLRTVAWIVGVSGLVMMAWGLT